MILVEFTQTNGRKVCINLFEIASISENPERGTTNIMTTATDACWYVRGYIDTVARALERAMDGE